MSEKPAFATILLYHGVTASPSRGIENFSRKHVPAEEFRRQMRLIREQAAPLSLREIAGLLVNGEKLPRNAVAVTFDDTFQNNYRVALPILKECHVPATFFVTTGFIASNRRFWVDRLEHAINLTQKKELKLSLGDADSRFELASEQERIEAVVAIKRAMKRLRLPERDAMLELILRRTGVEDKGLEVSNYANMTWEEVKGLHEPPFFEVGGHTVNHEILAYLDPPTLEREISQCKRALEENLGCEIDLFSYPEGQADHYNDEVIRVLKRFGIRICPSAVDGVNYPGADPFHLRRIMVGFMNRAFPTFE